MHSMRLEYATESIVLIVLLSVSIILAYNQKTKHPGNLSRSSMRVLNSIYVPLIGNFIAILAGSSIVSIIGYTILLLGMNLMILNMFTFAMDYCEFRYRGTLLQRLISLLITLNCLSTIANIYLHHIFTVKLDSISGTSSEKIFRIQSSFGRYINFAVLTVVMLVIVFAFVSKCIRVAHPYQEKYRILLSGFILCIIWETYTVLSNSAYDRSAIGYVFCGFLIYYFSFCYKPIFIKRYLSDSVIENHTDGIIFYDIDVNPIYANDKAYRILQVSDNTPDKCTDRLLDITGGVDINNDFDISSRYKDNEDNYRYININHRLMKDKNGYKIGSFFNIHDSTEEVLRNQERRWRSNHDELTGLYNKSRFIELVNAERYRNPSGKFYMIVSDINDFKFFNEVFGREEADHILVAIAQQITEICHNDTIYCRWNGDLFAAFARDQDVNLDELDKLVRSKASGITRINRQIIIHLGIYAVSGNDITTNSIVDRCLLAIASIKDDYSKRIVVYDDKLRKSRLWEQQITSDLDDAIEKQQIVPYIQPQYNDEGILEGGEMLVRWNHPTEGFLSPARFIPIIERNGMISKVDRYMWESACVILAKWKNTGKKLNLSINISPKDFYFMDIYKELTDLITKYDIQPARLHLEITETSVMNNAQKNISTLNRLREYGFTVEMDDFGSGYSSLNMLKDMPIDVLKIDMVFLSKTSNRDKSTIILQSIINMANELQLPQITEGVETRDQLDMLRRMGCKLFQGYYFSKPVPLDEFEALPDKAF